MAAVASDNAKVCYADADIGSGRLSKKPLERRSSSNAALYQLLGQLPSSPFLDAELADCSLSGDAPEGHGSPPADTPAHAQYTPAQLGSPTRPGLERRRLSRKLTAGKCVCTLPYLPMILLRRHCRSTWRGPATPSPYRMADVLLVTSDPASMRQRLAESCCD